MVIRSTFRLHLLAIHDISRMMFQDFPPQVGSFQMCIDFCRSQIFMTQQGLDNTQISTTLEQGCCKTMPKGMRRDGFLDSCILCRILNHDKNHRSGKMSTPSIEENIILLSLLDFHLIAVHIPIMQLFDGCFRNRNKSFLASLSQNTDEFFLLEDVA